MNAFDEIMKMIKHLTPFEILTLSQNLKDMTSKFILSDFIESSRFSEGYTCPRCKSKSIIRNGKKNGKQRYFCKDCKKNFMDTSNSIAYKSKFDISTWTSSN